MLQTEKNSLEILGFEKVAEDEDVTYYSKSIKINSSTEKVKFDADDNRWLLKLKFSLDSENENDTGSKIPESNFLHSEQKNILSLNSRRNCLCELDKHEVIANCNSSNSKSLPSNSFVSVPTQTDAVTIAQATQPKIAESVKCYQTSSTQTKDYDYFVIDNCNQICSFLLNLSNSLKSGNSQLNNLIETGNSVSTTQEASVHKKYQFQSDITSKSALYAESKSTYEKSSQTEEVNSADIFTEKSLMSIFTTAGERPMGDNFYNAIYGNMYLSNNTQEGKIQRDQRTGFLQVTDYILLKGEEQNPLVQHFQTNYQTAPSNQLKNNKNSHGTFNFEVLNREDVYQQGNQINENSKTSKTHLKIKFKKKSPKIKFLTICHSICMTIQIIKIPLVITHFLRPKILFFPAPKKIITNPITLHCRNFLSGEKKLMSFIGDVPRNSHAISAMQISKDQNDKKIKSKGFTYSNTSITQHLTEGETLSVVFHTKDQDIPSTKENIAVCLCDFCYYNIQDAISFISPSSKMLKDNINFVEDRQTTSQNYKSLDKNMYEISITKRLNEENIEHYCEVVNNHLLNIRNFDETELKNSVKILRFKWLKEVANKGADLKKITSYLDYFRSFSENLFKMITLITDTKGNNVLHFAFSNNRFDIVDLFLSSKYAKDLLKMKNHSGYSAFMICAISEPKTEFDWIIVYRAIQLVDINEAAEKSCQTPLMTAGSRGSELMVQFLLDAGADPDIQDADGSTALMYAAEHGHEKCVNLLLNHPRCDPTVKDHDKKSACSIALSAGHKDVALLIYLRTKTRSKSTSSYSWSVNEDKEDNRSNKNSRVNIYTLSR